MHNVTERLNALIEERPPLEAGTRGLEEQQTQRSQCVL